MSSFIICGSSSTSGRGAEADNLTPGTPGVPEERTASILQQKKPTGKLQGALSVPHAGECSFQLIFPWLQDISGRIQPSQAY